MSETAPPWVSLIARPGDPALFDAERYRCQCSTCRLGQGITDIRQALVDIDHATETWLDRDTDEEMRFAYLVDEVTRIAKLKSSFFVREELLDAVKLATAPPAGDRTHSTNRQEA